MIRRLIGMLVLPLACGAQGIPYYSNITTPAKNVPAGAGAPIYTSPNALITICAYPNNADPCTNTVAVYSDQGLTQPIPQPIKADGQGRYGFWIAPGLYTYSVVTQGGQGVGTSILSINPPQGPVGPAGPAGSTTATGTNGSFTVPGTLTATTVYPLSVPGNGSLYDPTPNAQQVITNAINANSATLSDGTALYYAGPPYPGIFPSDDSLTIRLAPQNFTATQISGLLAKMIANKNSAGDLPAGITATGAIHTTTGTLTTVAYYSAYDHAQLHASDPWFGIDLEYLAFQKTGTTTQFLADKAVLEAAIARVPLDGTTGLVYVSPTSMWVPWGFQEMARLTGDVLMGSLFLYRDATEMAAMYTAAGDSTDAARWTTEATRIKNSLNESSALWNGTDGMYHADTGLCASNRDIMGSAFAVQLGVTDATQTSAISNWLNTNYYSITDVYGFVLQTYNETTGSSDWASYGVINAGGSSVGAGPYGSGQYDNGYWSVMNYATQYALRSTSPARANQLITTQLSGSDPHMEYWNRYDTGHGGTPSLVSAMGAAAAQLALNLPSAPLPKFGIGTSNPDCANGLCYNDGGTNVKIQGTGARLAIEGSVAVEERQAISGIGTYKRVTSAIDGYQREQVCAGPSGASGFEGAAPCVEYHNVSLAGVQTQGATNFTGPINGGGGNYSLFGSVYVWDGTANTYLRIYAGGAVLHFANCSNLTGTCTDFGTLSSFGFGNIASVQTSGVVSAGSLATSQTPTASTTASDHSIPITLSGGATYYVRLSATP